MVDDQGKRVEKTLSERRRARWMHHVQKREAAGETDARDDVVVVRNAPYAIEKAIGDGQHPHKMKYGREICCIGVCSPDHND